MLTLAEIQAVPKVLLHDHLDGGLRPQTVLELAEETGYKDLPADNARDLAMRLTEGASRGHLEIYLDAFRHTVGVMQTREALTRVAAECAEDLAADGVVYAEVRFAPELHTRNGLTLDEVVEAVTDGFRKGAQGRSITVYALLTAMRTAARSLEIAEVAVRHRDHGVVGFDIAGAEAGWPPSRHLDAFEYVQRENFHITIHAGEAFGLPSIWEAVQWCGAERLGHGVRIVDDIKISDGGEVKLGRLAAYIRDRRIPLEMCPTSNVQTGAAPSIAQHPLRLLRQLSFRVTVNTDNRLMSQVTLSSEFHRLTEEFGYGWSDIEWLTVNAMKSAFAGFDERLLLINTVIKPGFAIARARSDAVVRGLSTIIGKVRRWDPERIGQYEILGRLGAGAMGWVYLGRSSAGRLVAVKTIRPELAEEPGFRTRFAQECAAARRVSGVFTAAVVAADPDADVPWLATAYIPAPSLRALVRKCGPLPAATVRWLAAGCAEALASIHDAGLVHLDLKPSNVLVGTDGPKVIDFGVARAAERIPGVRGPLGTPAYMAPEQARDPTQVSAASDVFSLGGTLLFAATGHPPYLGETTADVLVQLATGLPDLTDLPEELTGLVTECLARSPGLRPSSATILTRLGQFTEARSYLPAPALAFIENYHPVSAPERAAEHADDPQLSVGTQFGDDDQTAESYPGLPAQARPEAPALSFKHLRHLRLPVGAAWAMSGAVLIAVGVILGTTLSGGGGGGSSPETVIPPPPGPGTPQGPVCPASTTLCVTQANGTPQTVFAIHGSDLTPGVDVTVMFYPPPGSKLKSQTILTGHAHNPITLTNLRLGLYELVASLPSGQTATVLFVVYPPGGSPPPAAVAPPTPQANAPPTAQQAALRASPPQILLPGAPGRIGKPPQVRGGDDTVLDQRPDCHLVGQPHVARGQPAVGDLAAQHLEVLGNPCRQPVTELLVDLEPLQLVVGAGGLQCRPGDLRRPRQRRGGARVEQPRAAPHERDEEQLGHRVQVQRQERSFALAGHAGHGRRGPVNAGN
jgi:adenosine deaminase